jgi:hypothetical protein
MTWQRLFALDIALAFGLITGLMTLCLAQVAVIKERAYLAGAIQYAGTLRMDAMERIAHEGVLTPPSPSTTGREITPSYDEPKGQVRFRYHHMGSSVMTTGTLRANSPAFALSLHPAAPQGVPGWSVMWLCGHHAAPLGWTTVATAQADSLQAGHLPSVCK